VGTAYTPRSQAPSQYEYDEPLLPHPHPFKSHTSVSIGHWQTDIVNGATQMLRYDVVKNFEPVSLLADTPMWIAAKK